MARDLLKDSGNDFILKALTLDFLKKMIQLSDYTLC